MSTKGTAHLLPLYHKWQRESVKRLIFEYCREQRKGLMGREREIFSFWNMSIKELIDEKIGEKVMEQGLSKLKKPFYL